MFSSGWKLPAPQRMASARSAKDALYFVQETSSSGICLLHFLPQNASHRAARLSNSAQRRARERIHVKGDRPIHPYSGVFYFEVEVRSVDAVTGRVPNAINPWPSEPELVVGICQESLSPHMFPGEEACSIGLFASRRVVYANGKVDGNVARFVSASPPRQLPHERGSALGGSNKNVTPSREMEGRHTKGIKVGDTVGCIVNLLENTVRFTFNGELLDVVSAISHRIQARSFYPAVGVYRNAPTINLRVVFPPEGETSLVPRPVVSTAVESSGEAASYGSLENATAAASYFVFDVANYCRNLAEELQSMHQQNAAEGGTENDDSNGCTCHDANIVLSIRKHLAVRGLSKTLSAFEKEQEELRCSAESRAMKIPQGWDKLCMAQLTETSTPEAMEEKQSSNDTLRQVNGKSLDHVSHFIDYSQHIQQVRRDISRGEALAASRRIFTGGVISPETRDHVNTVVKKADTLPYDFWGLIFFTRRKDILFLLNVMHVLEMALNTMAKKLYNLLAAVRGTNGEENEGGEKREEKRDSQRETQQQPDSMPCLSTAAELMELALNVLIKPFDEMLTLTRRGSDISALSKQTIEEIAFGMSDDDDSELDLSRPSQDDDVAHLFFSDDETTCSSPEVLVTLLVRRSVANIPPPRSKQRRRIIQIISMLISHQSAMCVQATKRLCEGNAEEWIDDWFLLLEHARTHYRARCWSLLLHAIEDFNGALVYRLLVWQQRHEEEVQKTEKAEGLLPRNISARHAGESKSRWLFPSLRAAWRHVYAAAALNPLFHVVTNVFDQELMQAVIRTQVAMMATQNFSLPVFGKGPKCRFSPSPTCRLIGGEEKESANEQAEGSTVCKITKETFHSSGTQQKASYYVDDLRLSFHYMKSIYKAVFA